MVSYEWSIEIKDANGDIIDNDFCDKLKPLLERKWDGFKNLVLVRNEGDEINGLQDRFWAYVVDNKLPDYFEDGAGYRIGIKVPKRYHIEISKSL